MPHTPNRTEQRTRQRGRSRQAVSTDRFWVDPAKIPEDMSYEFKRHSYGGKEDPQHIALMLRNGFEPVPAKRHPELVGEKYAAENPEAAIIMDGQMLMERPKELREEADEEYKEVADTQVSDHVRRLKLTPDGQHERRVQSVSKKHDIRVRDEGSEEKRS